jgi:hypothetical protein
LASAVMFLQPRKAITELHGYAVHQQHTQLY